ncbi:hypothetical protein KSP40_PGU021754 [Platanthera guangdongensis]|uniref:Uncharacterized protein n=1 Tax=Platanthera guangdongensis TaxID=2320717 RepID=A0ABR2N3K0_9ASPA
MKSLIRGLARVADSSRYEPLRAAGKREGGRRTRVPAGHVPVFVGDEMERFSVRAELLSRPAFIELLRLSAMEYGYNQAGVLRIPCPANLFRRLLFAAEADFGEDLAADEISRFLSTFDPVSRYS